MVRTNSRIDADDQAPAADAQLTGTSSSTVSTCAQHLMRVESVGRCVRLAVGHDDEPGRADVAVGSLGEQWHRLAVGARRGTVWRHDEAVWLSLDEHAVRLGGPCVDLCFGPSRGPAGVELGARAGHDVMQATVLTVLEVVLVPFAHHPAWCAGPHHTGMVEQFHGLIPRYERAGVRASWTRSHAPESTSTT